MEVDWQNSQPKPCATRPLVSIIVPVYNTSKYLDQCIESLVNQTLQEIEIICVNDASPDDSLEKLKVWGSKDERIKIIDSPINRNLGGARNLGIRAATADYLGFVDSDDFVSHDFYQLLVDHSNHLTADISVASSFVVCSDTGEVLNEQRNVAETNNNLTDLKKQIVLNGILQVTGIFKKHLFVDNNLYYPENCHYEDIPIVPCLYLTAKSISVVKETNPIYFYRQNPSSISRRRNNYRLFDRINNCNLFLENAKRLGVYDNFRHEVDIRYYDLIYRFTLIRVFNTFTRLPVKEISEVIQQYGSLETKLKDNPYFSPYYRTNRGQEVSIAIVKFAAKYPFTYAPLRLPFLFLQRIKQILFG